jgi:hypothetical protein
MVSKIIPKENSAIAFTRRILSAGARGNSSTHYPETTVNP